MRHVFTIAIAAGTLAAAAFATTGHLVRPGVHPSGRCPNRCRDGRAGAQPQRAETLDQPIDGRQADGAGRYEPRRRVAVHAPQRIDR